MQVSDLMTDKVKIISADATIRQTAQTMAAINVGALPVAQDRKLVGMLTDRDITVRAVAQGLDPETTLAGQVMTTDVFTVPAEQEVTEAARAMRDKQVRRAPVLDSDQRLIGIVSLGDLAVKSGDAALSGEVLKGISQPAAPEL
jgi:CBS domain-containing protein